MFTIIIEEQHMKKLLSLLLVMSFCGGLLIAEDSFASKLSLGLSTGLSITLEDIDDDDANLIGLPVMIQVLYRLDPTFDIPTLGEATIDVGLKGGYLHLFTLESTVLGSDYKASMYTIPVLPYGRVNAGNFFVGIGIGLHLWTSQMTIDGEVQDLYGDNGIELCSMIEPGYAFPINDNLTALGSISIFSTSYESGDSENESSILTLNIGIEYSL